MRYPLLLSLLLATSAGSGASAAPVPNSCDKYLGAWEYVSPSPPGRSVISKYGDKYAIVWITGSEAAAADVTCGPTRDRFHIVYSVDPSAVGSDFELETEATADGIKWWVIGADGKRGEMGAARRLK
jgi:hypothetical protein